jgi:hypothetical protein
VRAVARHAVGVHWHGAPGLEMHQLACASAEGSAELRAGDGEALLRLHLFGGAGGVLRVEAGWVSYAYGGRQPAPVARWEQDGVGEQEVLTFVLPTPAGGRPRVVRELATAGGGGRAFSVEGDGWADLLLIGSDGTRVECDGVVSEAGWALVRRRTGAPPGAVAFARGGAVRLVGDDPNRS